MPLILKYNEPKIYTLDLHLPQNVSRDSLLYGKKAQQYYLF